MQLIINLKSLFISNLFRITFEIASLGLSSAFIKNLYIKILHLLLSISLKRKFSYNFVNYKTRLALFNVVRIKKLKCIYIDIYLIQIC